MNNHYFPRSNGSLVSILLPTRKRPAHLCAALDTINSFATNKQDLEFILKLDDDDQETIDLVQKFKSLIKIKTLVTERGRGYGDLHLWYNEMARMATGDWLFPFTDSARMTQEGWDTLIETMCMVKDTTWHGCKDICLLLCQTIGKPRAQEYLFIRRGIFDVLGFISGGIPINQWIISSVSILGCAFPIPIEIQHLVIDDEVSKVRSKVLEEIDFNSIDNLKSRLEVMNKLVNHIDKYTMSNK